MPKFLTVSQGSSEWHALRDGKIGSSDIASVISLKGAYKMRKVLLAEKAGRAPKPVSDFQARMFRDGHEWEAVAREKMEFTLGCKLHPIVVQDDENHRFIASLDGISDDRKTFVEIKSTVRAELFTTKEIPDLYDVQMQWQFLISGATRGVLVIVHRETGEMLVHENEPNKEKMNLLREKAEEFLTELEELELFEQPREIESTDSEVYMLAERKKRVKEMQDQIDAIETDIKDRAAALLNRFKATKITGFDISIETIERKGAVDYSKIKELEGVDLEKYRKKPTSFIQVKIKGTK